MDVYKPNEVIICEYCGCEHGGPMSPTKAKFIEEKSSHVIMLRCRNCDAYLGCRLTLDRVDKPKND